MSYKARVTLEPKLDTGKASKPQWARLLPARPEDPSLTPGTHTVERENCAHTMSSDHHMDAHTKQNFIKSFMKLLCSNILM